MGVSRSSNPKGVRTSPYRSGIRAIARLNGPDVAAKIWDAIEKKRGKS
jgi:glutathione synthase